MKSNKLMSFLLASLLAVSSLASVMTVSASAAETAPAPQNYIAVAQPQTNIVGDISLIRAVSSKAEMEAMVSADSTPAVALYTVNADLNALDSEGQPFATLDEVFSAHAYKIIPAFRVNDKAAANALAAYLDGLNFYDCLLVSADPALLKETREALPYTVGILDLTETYQNETALTREQCLDIRRATKTYNANVALLPAHLCEKDTVQYLYEHQVNVWMQISDEPGKAEQYNALLSGAVGVISDATESLLDIACNQLPTQTMTRTPLNVGHRGIPSMAPECTVEGSLLAYEQSANVVEMDVFLTADGRVAAMHDITTGDTCNGNLHMEECTLAELKELYVNRGWENNKKYSQLRIPTLDEYLEAFRDTDCMLFIEIKSHKEEIVPIIRDMVNEYDMYDQCNVITFNTDTMEYMRKHWPEMALGVLCEDWYGFMNGTNPDADLRTVMEFAAPHNGTVNPGFEAYSPREIRAFLLRGISVNPWTFYGAEDYLPHYLDGFASLTGNDANVIKRLTQYVSYDLENALVEVGEALPLKLSVTSYNRATRSLAAHSVLILEGEELVEIHDDHLIVVGESGQISFVLGYTDRTLDYTVYTQPITVSIKTEEVTTAAPETEAPVTEAETSADKETSADTTKETIVTDDPGTKFEDPGCGSSISAVSFVILAVALAPMVCKKKED